MMTGSADFAETARAAGAAGPDGAGMVAGARVDADSSLSDSARADLASSNFASVKFSFALLPGGTRRMAATPRIVMTPRAKASRGQSAAQPTRRVEAVVAPVLPRCCLTSACNIARVAGCSSGVPAASRRCCAKSRSCFSMSLLLGVSAIGHFIGRENP